MAHTDESLAIVVGQYFKNKGSRYCCGLCGATTHDHDILEFEVYPHGESPFTHEFRCRGCAEAEFEYGWRRE